MNLRLYCDEDSMDQEWLRALRARGMDVTTALDENMISRGDERHLDYATQQGRVLFSFNRGDFYRLHTHYLSQGKSHVMPASSWPTSSSIRSENRPDESYA